MAEAASEIQLPVKYDLTTAEIARMKSEYMSLTIQGVNDKGGLAAVHEARMDCKRRRVAVENRRLEFGRQVLSIKKQSDDEAKRLIAELAPVEEHLAGEEKRIEDAKAAAREAERARVQTRVDALLAFGVALPWDDVAALSDEEYQDTLDYAREEHEKAEAARRAREEEEARAREAEAAARAEEARRLAQERAEQEAEAKRLKAEADALQASKDRVAKAQAKIDADRRALEEEKRLEAARKEAAEKAAREERERSEREKREAEERERRAAEENARQEALKPDKEKMTAWAEAMRDRPIATPALKSDAAQDLMADVLDEIERILCEFQREVMKL